MTIARKIFPRKLISRKESLMTLMFISGKKDIFDLDGYKNTENNKI